MWHNFSLVFVTFVSSTIFIPAIHYFCSFVLFIGFPIKGVIMDLYYEIPYENLFDLIEKNSIRVQLSYYSEIDRLNYIWANYWFSLFLSTIMGIWYGIRLARWLLLF